MGFEKCLAGNMLQFRHLSSLLKNLLVLEKKSTWMYLRSTFKYFDFKYKSKYKYSISMSNESKYKYKYRVLGT